MSESTRPPRRADWALAQKAWPYLRPELWLYVVGMLSAPASALLVVAQPWLLRVAIDDYIRVGDLDGVQQVGLWYLGAVLLAFVLEATYTLAMSYGALRSIARLRRRGPRDGRRKPNPPKR